MSWCWIACYCYIWHEFHPKIFTDSTISDTKFYSPYTGKVSQHLISVWILQFARICDLGTTLLIFEYWSAPQKIINIHFSPHFIQFKIHLIEIKHIFWLPIRQGHLNRICNETIRFYSDSWFLCSQYIVIWFNKLQYILIRLNYI